MNTKVVGGLLFVVAAVVAIGYGLLPEGGAEVDPLARVKSMTSTETVHAMGFVGGETRAFLDDPQVVDRLRDRFGLVLDARKAGSIEMISSPEIMAQSPSFLWSASPLAREAARRQGIRPLKDEIIFNSPIVFYSWSPIAEALAAKGLAKPLGEGTTGITYQLDLKGMLDLMRDKVTWADIGVQALYGTVMVQSTDPVQSNSGNQFAALVTTILAGDDPDEAKLVAALDRTATLFRRMGYMEHSSSDLFEQYLRTGMGGKPLVVGYENQLIEFAAANPGPWSQLESREIRPVIFYPMPTVFSSHVILALDQAGRTVAEALKDPGLQDIAWRSHGFRSGFAASDPALLPIGSIPGVVGMVAPMPPLAVMDRIEASLGHKGE